MDDSLTVDSRKRPADQVSDDETSNLGASVDTYSDHKVKRPRSAEPETQVDNGLADFVTSELAYAEGLESDTIGGAMKTTSSVESDHYDVAFPDKRHEENLFEQNSRVDNPQVPAVPGRDAQMNGTATFANDFLPTSPPQEKTSSNDPLLQEQLKFCGNVLKSIKRLKDAKPFLQPVDPIALNIPTYLDVIKHPMDISTMERKLKQNEYSSIEHFKNDMQLILDNCVTFNGPDSAVSQSGKSVIRSFKKYMEKLPQNVKFDKSRKKSLAMDSPSDQFGEGGRPKRDIHPPVKEISRTASPTPLKAGTPKSKNADKDLKFCAEVLRELYKKQHAAYNFPFLLPVDPIALGIPHYHDVIKFPMDLSTVKKKLENQAYHSTEEFEADVRLMFNNCYTFNPPGTDVYNYGKKLEEVFDRKLREKPQFQAHTPVPIRTPRPSKANIKPQFNDASSSSDPDDDDDDTDTKQLILLQQQLQAITTQMAWLQEKRAKKKQKKRSLGNLAKVDASSTKPPRIPKSKVKSSTSGTRKQKSTKKKTSDQYKARRRVEYSSDEGESADKLPELTYDQKAELVNLVNELTHDNVEKVMDIIRSGSGFPDTIDQGEIELDMAALSKSTLWKLYKFVKGASSSAGQPSHTQLKHQKQVNKHANKGGRPVGLGRNSDTSSNESDSGTESADSADST